LTTLRQVSEEKFDILWTVHRNIVASTRRQTSRINERQGDINLYKSCSPIKELGESHTGRETQARFMNECNKIPFRLI
jgi:hypothetical protein